MCGVKRSIVFYEPFSHSLFPPFFPPMVVHFVTSSHVVLLLRLETISKT
jgi:hypothetical protein